MPVAVQDLIQPPMGQTTSHYAVKETPELRSNGGKSIDPSDLGWLRETSKDTDCAEMQRRYKEDGYILIKHLIPREDIFDMREHYFTHMGSTGLIDPDRNPRDGIFNPSSSPDDFTSIGAPKYPDGDKLQALAAAHCTPEYLEFLRHPALRSFVRELMGWDKEVLLARTLLRHCVPNGISSAIHYDKIFLRGGDPTNNFLTAWVPIGDIAQNGGGLIYLEGSTDLGKQIEADFTEKAKEFTKEERMNAYNKNMAANGSLGDDAEEFYQREGKGLRGSKKWLATNYEAGDVIFHNPYIVHGTSMNEDQFNRIRLSTDLRFYEEGTSLDERWFRVWTPDDGL